MPPHDLAFGLDNIAIVLDLNAVAVLVVDWDEELARKVVVRRETSRRAE